MAIDLKDGPNVEPGPEQSVHERIVINKNLTVITKPQWFKIHCGFLVVSLKIIYTVLGTSRIRVRVIVL